MKFRTYLGIAAFSFAFASSALSEALPADHPTAAFLKKYYTAMVSHDWPSMADMLYPSSLEKRHQTMVANIKRSTTLTEEAVKLDMVGLKDIRELEKMSPKDAYVAERKAVDKRSNLSAEAQKKMQDTLNVNILGLIAEDNGKTVHAVVRVKQETLDRNFEQLSLVSLVQDPANAKKWFVVPDSMDPILKPLKGAAPAAP